MLVYGTYNVRSTYAPLVHVYFNTIGGALVYVCYVPTMVHVYHTMVW
jgi:hypothetical protein